MMNKTLLTIGLTIVILIALMAGCVQYVIVNKGF